MHDTLTRPLLTCYESVQLLGWFKRQTTKAAGSLLLLLLLQWVGQACVAIA